MEKIKSKNNGISENESYSLSELPAVLAEKAKEIEALQKQIAEKDNKLAEIGINYDALNFQFNKKDRYFRDVLNHKKQCTTLNTKIEIDPEIQSIIPPLSQDELELLAKSIRQEGVRDPIIVWAVDETNILLDGHNRHKICVEYGIQCAVEIKFFQNRNHALNWVIDNQLGRRNLTTEQKNYLIGKRYEGEKKEHGGDRNVSSGKSCHLKTREKIATQVKVSPRTVSYAEKFAKAVDKIESVAGNNAKKQILSGELKTSQKDVIELAQKTDDRIRESIETGQIKHTVGQNDTIPKELKQFLSAFSIIEANKDKVKELILDEDIEADNLLLLKTLIEDNIDDISEVLKLATEVVQSSLFEELQHA